LLTLVVPGNTVSAEAQELFVWGISKGEVLLEHCFGPGMLGISGRIWGIAFEAIVEKLVCFSRQYDQRLQQARSGQSGSNLSIAMDYSIVNFIDNLQMGAKLRSNQ
jgi:hypothetical protein